MSSFIERTCLWTGCGKFVKTKLGSKYGVCPECRHVTCFTCKAVHEGISCRTFKSFEEPPPLAQSEELSAPVAGVVPTDSATRQIEAGVKTLSVSGAGSPECEENQTQKSSVEQYLADELLATCQSGSCKFQAFVDGNAKQLCCPKCHKITCLDCMAVHEFITCLEYQTKKNPLALVPELQREGAAATPTVAVPVECFTEAQKPAEATLPCCACETEKLQIQIAEMRPCLHLVCLTCVEEGARQSPTYLVRCPAKDPDGRRCQSYVNDSLLKRVLSDEMYLSHKSLMGLALQSCATEDCTGKFSIRHDMKTAKCLDCQKVNCIPCKAIHENKTCKEFLQELVARLDGVPLQNLNDDDDDDDDSRNEKIACATAGCDGIGHSLPGNERAVWCSRCKQVTCLLCKRIHTADICPHAESDSSDADENDQELQEGNAGGE
uniref:Putative ubiquitin conjugating enzyme 7 n=2 Tax=Ixodes ricinus TaxID=34613 RepID=V5HXU0_IXORI